MYCILFSSSQICQRHSTNVFIYYAIHGLNCLLDSFQLQTFELDASYKKLEDVQDGMAMAQALHQM